MTFFIAAFGDGGDMVPYVGKVFEAGDYPDKAFAITPHELLESAQAFAGVDLDLEHSEFRDLLGHRLGRLEKLWIDGRDAIGRLSVPRWLHELSDGRLQTSLTFDQGKQIVGCALTLSPRIPDAEVYAAFSRKEMLVMPTSLRDRLKVLFKKAPQAVEEAGIDPAEIESVDFGDQPASPVQGVANPHAADAASAGDPHPMAPTNREGPSRLTSPGGATLADCGADLDIAAQLAEFKATNDRLIAGQLHTYGALFADTLIREAKAVPAQRDQLIALFKQSAIADGSGSIRFSATGQPEEGANLKQLKELFRNAHPHTLFNTDIRNGDPNEAEPDKALVERLRGATALGQATIKKEAK